MCKKVCTFSSENRVKETNASFLEEIATTKYMYAIYEGALHIFLFLLKVHNNVCLVGGVSLLVPVSLYLTIWVDGW